MTGRHPAAHQVYRNGNAYFPKEEILATKLLADSGYDCGLIGKLHSTASKFENVLKMAIDFFLGAKIHSGKECQTQMLTGNG